MFKRLVFIFIFLILLGVVAYFYINNVFLPVKFKNFVENHAQQFLHKGVSIGEISFEPVKGIIVRDITIYEETERRRALAEIKEVYFNILLAPLFKNKHIIIPAVHVVHPKIDITRNPDGSWNFGDMLNRPKVEKQQSQYTVFLRKLKLENGELNFLDNARENPFFESLNGVDLEAILSLDKAVKYSLRAHLSDENSKFNITGEYAIDQKQALAKITFSNIPLSRYLNAYAPAVNVAKGDLSYGDIDVRWQAPAFDAEGGLTVENLEYRSAGQAEILGTFNINQAMFRWENGRITAKGKIDGKNTRARLPGEGRLALDLGLDIEQFNFDNRGLNLAGKAGGANVVFTSAQGGPSFTGNLETQFRNISYFDGTLKASFGIGVNKGELKLGAGRSVSASLGTQNTIVTLSTDSLEVSTDLQLVTPSIRWDKLAVDSDVMTMKNITFADSGESRSVSASVQTGHMAARWEDTYRFEGSPTVTAEVVLPKAGDTLLSYKIKTDFVNARISGIPNAGELADVRGSLTVEPDLITVPGLDLLWQGMNMQAKGNVKQFASPVLDMEVTSSALDFKKASALFPEYTEEYQIYPEGLAAVKLSFKGGLSNPAAAAVKISAALKNASVFFKSANETVKDITGDITVDTAKSTLRWDDLRLHVRDMPVSLNGQLTDFSRPSVKTKMETGKISAYAEANILRRAVQFTALKGTYANSALDIIGDAHFPEGEEPRGDFRGSFTLDLADLPSILPQYREQLEPYQLGGKVNGRGLFKGKLADWKNWQLTFDAESSAISAFGHTLNTVVFKYGQRDQAISTLDAAGTLYDGTLTLNSSVDLRTDDMPINLMLSLTKLDLAALRREKMRTSELAGLLNFNLKASGPIGETRKITGGGSLTITEGFLYHKSTKEGLIGVLFVIPEVQELVFSDAAANFKIRNNRVNIDNALLSSRQVTMDVNGWVDIDKKYDLTLRPKVSDLVMAKSESARKIPTTLITQLITYRCSGQVGVVKNTCARTSNPINLLESTVGEAQHILKESVGELLGDIFGN